MAGNIIHAIATTNAIISGLIVIEALKLLAAGGDPAACKATYLRQDLSNKRLLMPAKLESPAAGCRVCGAARLHVRIDTAATKFEDFLAKIVRGHLGLQEYSITLGTMTIYEESEDLEDDEVAMYAQKLGMPLAELPAGGIGHGTSVFVRDEALNWEIELLVSHKADWDEEASPGRYIIEGTLPPPPTPAAPAPAPAEDASAATALEPIALEEEDGTFVLLESENEGPAKGGDRKRKAEDGEELGGKRAKGDEGDEDAIELLD